ncbi:MAG: S1C family serine protease [Chloroflexota bacterium]
MTEHQESHGSALSQISDQLADASERASVSIVSVDARRRYGASGIVWTDGIVVTADHVVEQEDSITVTGQDGRRQIGALVGRDPDTDLAVLRVAGLAAPGITRGQTPRVGSLALLVARPFGNPEASLAPIRAVASDARRRRQAPPLPVIGVDVTFRPGYSGGALVDVQGYLLGIATSGFGRGQGGGVVVSLPRVEQVVNSLLQHGRVRRGYLGITSQPVEIPDSMRGAVSEEQTRGLLILNVAPSSPAEQGGLLMGDILITIADVPTRGPDDLRAALSAERVGVLVPVTVVRGGQSHTLSITIGEQA